MTAVFCYIAGPFFYCKNCFLEEPVPHIDAHLRCVREQAVGQAAENHPCALPLICDELFVRMRAGLTKREARLAREAFEQLLLREITQGSLKGFDPFAGVILLWGALSDLFPDPRDLGPVPLAILSVLKEHGFVDYGVRELSALKTASDRLLASELNRLPGLRAATDSRDYDFLASSADQRGSVGFLVSLLCRFCHHHDWDCKRFHHKDEVSDVSLESFIFSMGFGLAHKAALPWSLGAAFYTRDTELQGGLDVLWDHSAVIFGAGYTLEEMLERLNRDGHQATFDWMHARCVELGTHHGVV